MVLIRTSCIPGSRHHSEKGQLAVVSSLPCPWSLALSLDARHLFVFYRCGGPGGSRARDVLDVLELTTMRSAGRVSGLPMVRNEVRLSPDGAQIWLLDADACINYTYDRTPCPWLNRRLVHIFGYPELTRIETLGLNGQEGALSFTPDGSRVVVSGTETRVLKTSNFATADMFSTTSPLYRITFTVDGRSAFALLRRENQVALFDLQTSHPIRTGWLMRCSSRRVSSKCCSVL